MILSFVFKMMNAVTEEEYTLNTQKIKYNIIKKTNNMRMQKKIKINVFSMSLKEQN